MFFEKDLYVGFIFYLKGFSFEDMVVCLNEFVFSFGLIELVSMYVFKDLFLFICIWEFEVFMCGVVYLVN